MSASYPTSVKAFSNRSAGQTIASAHLNDVQDEVNAVETALVNGPIKPAGGSNAAPPYAFNNNATTGLYSSGASALELATGGVKALGIDSTQFIDSPTQPRCAAYNNAVLSVADVTATALALNSEDYDTAAMHDTVTTNSRVTVPTGGDGLYLIVGFTTFAADVDGVRQLAIRKNGVTSLRSTASPVNSGAATVVAMSVQVIVALVATDYVELVATHSAGNALNVGSASRESASSLDVVKLW
jgi:hypothetical protein